MVSRHHVQDFIVEENKKYDELNIKGVLLSQYDIYVSLLNVKGIVITDKNLNVYDYAKIKGRVKANNITAESLKIHGQVTLNCVSGNNVKIISGRNSSICSVKGNNIEIRNGYNKEDNEKVVDWIFNYFKIGIEYKEDLEEPQFCIDAIYGNIVNLTGIQVDFIEADSIVLRGNCKVKK